MTFSKNLYTFNQLNPESAILANAIYTYCKHMNCIGMEAQADDFLQSKLGQNIKFYEDGTLFLHEVNNFT